MNTFINGKETVVVYYSICLAMCYDRGQDTYAECMENYYMTLNDYDFINDHANVCDTLDNVNEESPIVYSADAVKNSTTSYIKSDKDIDEVLSTDRLLVIGRRVDKDFIDFVISNNGKRIDNRIEKQWEKDHGYNPVHDVVDIISYKPVFVNGVFVDWEIDNSKEPEVKIGSHPSDIIRCDTTHAVIDRCKCITCLAIQSGLFTYDTTPRVALG